MHTPKYQENIFLKQRNDTNLTPEVEIISVFYLRYCLDDLTLQIFNTFNILTEPGTNSSMLNIFCWRQKTILD